MVSPSNALSRIFSGMFEFLFAFAKLNINSATIHAKWKKITKFEMLIITARKESKEEQRFLISSVPENTNHPGSLRKWPTTHTPSPQCRLNVSDSVNLLGRNHISIDCAKTLARLPGQVSPQPPNPSQIRRPTTRPPICTSTFYLGYIAYVFSKISWLLPKLCTAEHVNITKSEWII